MKREQFVRWKLPAILYGLFILFLTSYPTLETPSLGVDWQDKIYHFGAYLVFGFLMARAFTENRLNGRRQLFFKSFLFATLFAIFDEIHQLFIPGRSGEVLDACADIGGVLLAHFLFIAYARRVVNREGTIH